MSLLSNKDAKEIRRLLEGSGKNATELASLINGLAPELIELLNNNQKKLRQAEQENKKLTSKLELAHLKIKNYEEEVRYGKSRLKNIIEILMALAILDFNKQASVTGKSDEYDGLATGLNMLGQELKASTVSINYLEDIFQSITDILLVVDDEGHIHTSNPAARSMFGDKLQDNDIHSFITELGNVSVKEFTAKELKNIIRDGKVVKTEIVCKNTSGAPIPLAVQLSPMQSSKDVVMIARDISERKKAEQTQKQLISNLERSNDELRQFAYVASHDLKAPLRAISMLAQWVMEESAGVLNDDSKSNLDMLIERAQRMYSFLDGMLAYSRIGFNQELLQEIDLNKVVSSVVLSLNVPAWVSIKIHELPKVTAAEIHMIQVFQNLISNAINYLDKNKGKIEVGVTTINKETCFYVKDNGPGIDKAFFDKIFVIFQTLKERDKSESTGIGLTIVKKILEGYSGKIWLESELGQGSCFYFTIPNSH
ncbi:MAG: ATP-binding protein [Bacteroidota bacterium]